MIIQTTARAPDADTAAFAWSGLKRFLNTEYVSQFLMSLHQLPRSQKGNAEKQANQIRYSLMQAQEYAAAADRVTLATKPTLIYYSVMCLALAKILMKQTG